MGLHFHLSNDKSTPRSNCFTQRFFSSINQTAPKGQLRWPHCHLVKNQAMRANSVALSCPTLCNPIDYSLPSFFVDVHGIFLGRNTRVGCCFHLQGIVLTHPNLLHLLHWQADSMSLYFLGLPKTKPGGWNNTVLWPDHHMQSCPGEDTMLTQPHPATTILSLGGSSLQPLSTPGK